MRVHDCPLEILSFKWQRGRLHILWQKWNLTSFKLNRKKPMNYRIPREPLGRLGESPHPLKNPINEATKSKVCQWPPIHRRFHHCPPAALPRLDHHRFCTSVRILFCFGFTVFAWEIMANTSLMGGQTINITQCFLLKWRKKTSTKIQKTSKLALSFYPGY